MMDASSAPRSVGPCAGFRLSAAGRVLRCVPLQDGTQGGGGALRDATRWVEAISKAAAAARGDPASLLALPASEEEAGRVNPDAHRVAALVREGEAVKEKERPAEATVRAEAAAKAVAETWPEELQPKNRARTVSFARTLGKASSSGDGTCGEGSSGVFGAAALASRASSAQTELAPNSAPRATRVTVFSERIGDEHGLAPSHYGKGVATRVTVPAERIGDEHNLASSPVGHESKEGVTLAGARISPQAPKQSEANLRQELAAAHAAFAAEKAAWKSEARAMAAQAAEGDRVAAELRLQLQEAHDEVARARLASPRVHSLASPRKRASLRGTSGRVALVKSAFETAQRGKS